MKKLLAAVLFFLLLAACGQQVETPTLQAKETSAPLPTLEATAWQALSTDGNAFGLTGGFTNPNFEYVFQHTDSVPLDQLVAFLLISDAASEGAMDELRSRFLEAPNTVLIYLLLLKEQTIELSGWEPAPTAEVLCDFIARADAAWYGDSGEFATVVADCRASWPEGPIAELLNILEAKRTQAVERNRPALP